MNSRGLGGGWWVVGGGWLHLNLFSKLIENREGTMKNIWLIPFLLVAVASFPAEPLIVHEWGTFTSLQDEAGIAVGGINTDDEPVPDFVHNIAGMLLISPTEAPPIFFQGAPHCHPDVTMRLETPVLYFHADRSFHGTVGVRVEFRGGWLTQFFPVA